MAGLLIIVLIIILIIALKKTPATIKSNWKHYYDGQKIFTTYFYDQLKAELKKHEINGLFFAKEAFLESHIFSSRREYLRITVHEYVFYICVAPFGTGTFISWWLCIEDEKVINKIPILSKLAGKDRNNKSFYQMDTEAMFQSAIHNAVLSVADAITTEKGHRLTELDRQYKELAK